MSPQRIAASPLSDRGSCVANRSASTGRALAPRRASLAVSLSRGGTAKRSAHRIRECARNRGIRTGGNPGDDKTRDTESLRKVPKEVISLRIAVRFQTRITSVSGS